MVQQPTIDKNGIIEKNLGYNNHKITYDTIAYNNQSWNG